ncbi:hypothetical protein COTS27_01369 [Spirochaetota bacterium]|nr:hypothetical protein COTS27_01369 [Spirochaetota bacterium]
MNIWEVIQNEINAHITKNAQLLQSPLGTHYKTIFLEKSSLAKAISILLSTALTVPADIDKTALKKIFYDTLSSVKLQKTLTADLIAIYERDPACNKYYMALLYYKGFHAISLHRIAHALIKKGQEDLAFYLNMLSTRTFTIDIHPRARIGDGLFIDHGNSIVIGETTVIDEEVSILQDVTLGGTGKESGDRHPKIKKGVLIGAGAKILGNVTIGAYSKIGAGSVVLKNMPAYATIVGVPAQVVKIDTPKPGHDIPAKEMDHFISMSNDNISKKNIATPPTYNISDIHNIQKKQKPLEVAAKPPAKPHSANLLVGIDIGSNTIMMTLVEIPMTAEQKTSRNLPTTTTSKQNQKLKYYDFIRFASLAQGLRKNKTLTASAVARSEIILNEYKNIIAKATADPTYLTQLPQKTAAMQEANTELHFFQETPLLAEKEITPPTTLNHNRSYCIKAVATSALREAHNNNLIKFKLETALAAPIEIIDAKREASLTFLGTTKNEQQPVITIDLGGGSTEISWGHQGTMLHYQGFSIGAVSWNQSYPHKMLQSAAARITLKETLQQLITKEASEQPLTADVKSLFEHKKPLLIGVAGVPTTLAAIHYNLNQDTLLAVDQKILTLEQIETIMEKLAQTSLETLINDTETWTMLSEARANIMLFSTIALHCLMKYLKLDIIKVSIRGLRYGLLEELHTQLETS